MVTIEDKLNLFSKIIYDKANEKIKNKLEAAQKEEAEAIEKEAKAINEYKERISRDLLRKCKSSYEQEVFKASYEGQQQLINLRNTMINETLDSIKDRLTEFMNSKEYEEYIFSKIATTLENIKEDNFVTIYFNDADLNKFKEGLNKLKSKNNVEISPTGKDILGGYIVEDKNMRFRIDCSLDSSVEECVEKIGIKITEILV